MLLWTLLLILLPPIIPGFVWDPLKTPSPEDKCGKWWVNDCRCLYNGEYMSMKCGGTCALELCPVNTVKLLTTACREIHDDICRCQPAWNMVDNATCRFICDHYSSICPFTDGLKPIPQVDIPPQGNCSEWVDFCTCTGKPGLPRSITCEIVCHTCKPAGGNGVVYPPFPTKQRLTDEILCQRWFGDICPCNETSRIDCEPVCPHVHSLCPMTWIRWHQKKTGMSTHILYQLAHLCLAVSCVALAVFLYNIWAHRGMVDEDGYRAVSQSMDNMSQFFDNAL